MKSYHFWVAQKRLLGGEDPQNNLIDTNSGNDFRTSRASKPVEQKKRVKNEPWSNPPPCIDFGRFKRFFKRYLGRKSF